METICQLCEIVDGSIIIIPIILWDDDATTNATTTGSNASNALWSSGFYEKWRKACLIPERLLVVAHSISKILILPCRENLIVQKLNGTCA